MGRKTSEQENFLPMLKICTNLEKKFLIFLGAMLK